MVTENTLNVLVADTGSVRKELVAASLLPDIKESNDLKSPSGRATLPSVEQCLGHLKLLWAFHRLREEVCAKEEDSPDAFISDPAEIEGKRWAAHVARAARRFTAWWASAVPKTTNGQPNESPNFGLKPKGWLQNCGNEGTPMDFTADNLPPLDVLMVWHTYTLNPRIFFKACHENGKVDFWKTGLPWGAINSAVDPVSFKYTLTDAAAKQWTLQTSLDTDNQSVPVAQGVSHQTPHGLSLSGAVLRQSKFVAKMADINWYHSPSACSIIGRSIERYERFVQLMKYHPGKVLVPTLDIDLAWHTHQTQPAAYYGYVILQAGRFVNHDDDVDAAGKGSLSEMFEFTSWAYSERYSEPYIEFGDESNCSGTGNCQGKCQSSCGGCGGGD